MELETVEFDLEDLLERTCEMLAVRAHEKGLELTCRTVPGVPTLLIGDPNRLRQVLVNLLGNAVKFTEQGEIYIEVSSGASSDGGVVLHFTIRDSGIGIPDDKVATIFDNFAQGDSSTTRKYGGSGLGLAICRRLVNLMGGEISVESQMGKGSTFTFSIRSELQAMAFEQSASGKIDLHGIRVLVVDDNAVNRFIMTEMLQRCGAVITEVDNGEAAIKELRYSHDTGNIYNLMLLDCRMPGMDGFQVIEHIRRDEDLSHVRALSVMMLTSDNRTGDLGRIHELGVGCYLVKPVKRLEMLDAASRILTQNRLQIAQHTAAAIPPVTADINDKKILLVEDTPDNRMLIKAFLKNSGYQTDEAENGAAAVEKYLAGNYALVLMDMQMPVMDGYTATREIRMLEKKMEKPPIPIIALTAYAFEEDIRKSMDAGCDYHLSKPVRKGDLLECIGKYAGGG
jgi:CheY-like chemotaxis protein